MPTAQFPRQITAVQHAGHSALLLRTRHGTAVIALHGAHVLSWVPAGSREVFWLSPASLPEPAAIRGGVPVCWPWFAKQGQSTIAAQHGPVRNLPWQLTDISHSSDEEITLSMEPAAQTNAAPDEAWATGVPAGLRVRVSIALGRTLRQTLHTDNLGTTPFMLSQALHSYYAVSHAQRVSIEGLQGLPYTDRLRALAQDVQNLPFALGRACDRTYAHPPVTSAPEHRRYTLVDTAWQRRIDIDMSGSRSVVVWNPGSETARQMVDVPDDGWPDFFCIEAANAGPDVIRLAPGAWHQLTQTLSVSDCPVQAT
jgi:glucose-6-phosphate 1-epimerase